MNKTAAEAVELDPYDDPMEDEFAGDWTELEPIKVPTPDKLPLAAYGVIARRLGIDMVTEGGDAALKIAANEWFWRNLRGQRVTFRRVLRGGSMANVVDNVEKEPADADDVEDDDQAGDVEDPTPPPG